MTSKNLLINNENLLNFLNAGPFKSPKVIKK